ncbi:Holliday junction resolvase RuvX [Limnoglobus roseus]|uniref:Putative pre-16S rRNA nuclease n=1 Tax=Limnoglobus roseus TaxID=2598579 RepID=A0A5C1AHA9_9BACT|nr:Holliday junction resolvase RuvX [Limnoglobus roseus]QEL18809.1 Holliday junction resolvase RuvX [Limnoglobus roseus]
MTLPARGRLLGIDPGTVRIGLAVCDPDRIIASPHGTYERRSPDADAAFFRQLMKAEQIVGFVVGLPISLNDTEGPKAKESREFAMWLTAETGLPVAFSDERFTSSYAEDSLIAAGVRRDKRKGKRDRIAAQFILQAFLDVK